MISGKGNKTKEASKNQKTKAGKSRIQNLAAQLSRDHEENSRKRKIKRWIYSIAALIAIVAAWFIWKALEPVQVNSALVSYQRVGTTAQPILRLSGFVTYPRIATISVSLQSPVTELGFDLGDHVQEGAFLASFENTELLERRKMQQITVQNLEATLNRTRNLNGAGAASEADLQQAENQLELAKSNLDLLNTQINSGIVRAPFSGLITAKMVEVGEVASRGICRLADDSSILVEVNVNQEDFTKINADQSAVVILDGYPEMEYAASIYEIMPTADAATNTINVKVKLLDPDARFKPNMSAKVLFVDQPVSGNTNVQAVLTVDKSAIFKRDGRNYVWLIQDGRLRERELELGRTIADRLVEIKSGIEPNQRVLIEPQNYDMKAGDRVEIQ